MSEKFFLAKLGDKSVALSSLQVNTLDSLNRDGLTTLPQTPNWISGVASYNNHPTVVFDPAEDAKSEIVFFGYFDGISFGLAISSVVKLIEDVKSVQLTEFECIQNIKSFSFESRWVLNYNGEDYHLLNLEQLFDQAKNELTGVSNG